MRIKLIKAKDPLAFPLIVIVEYISDTTGSIVQYRVKDKKWYRKTSPQGFVLPLSPPNAVQMVKLMRKNG